MGIGLIGRKIGMTQIFNQEGKAVCVTVLEMGPCHVTDVITKDKRGYDAVQVGYMDIDENRLSKPVLGQFKNGIKPKRYLKEFRVDKHEDAYSLGKVVKVDIFSEGQLVDVQGVSKGKGFQGVIRRHNFSGGRKTHGSHFHRIPGSIGNNSTPAKVYKGRKMPGHMGNEKVTVQKLRVVKLDIDNNLMAVRGGVPGPNGSLVRVVSTTKVKLSKLNAIKK